VPDPSFLLPGRLRSAFSHSRISPGSTRRTKTWRSAFAITSQSLFVRGAHSEGWGNCRTAFDAPELPESRVFESPRRDTLREREDHPRGPARPAPVGPLLSWNGDMVERERRHRGRLAGRRQLAVGSEREAECRLAIRQLVNWKRRMMKSWQLAESRRGEKEPDQKGRMEIEPDRFQRDAGRCYHTLQHSTLVLPRAAAPVAAAPPSAPQGPRVRQPPLSGPGRHWLFSGPVGRARLALGSRLRRADVPRVSQHCPRVHSGQWSAPPASPPARRTALRRLAPGPGSS